MPAITNPPVGLLFCGVVIAASFTVRAGSPVPADQPVQRTVAVTVDDLPGAEPGTDHATGNLKELEKINHAIPAALRSHHTYTHFDFQTTPLAQYEDDTIRGEVVTRSLLAEHGQTEKYFRHPFLNTGPTAEAKAAFEAFLKDRGYRVAPVTVDVSDYMFNDIVGESIEKRDKKLGAKAKKEYLAYADTVFDYEEQASRDLFQREIPQVLLIHDSALNAEYLDALLAQLEKRGYKFISLDDALADPAYATPDLYVGPLGISWLTRWKFAFGQKPDLEKGPEPPKWVSQKFEEIRRAHAND
jgi:peptidoglycan/xylan/chitin deacetylase (PgdA/CDA1 family)